MTEDHRPEFGVTDHGRGFFTRPESEWQDDELCAGIRQIDRRISELTQLRDRLTDEQARRKELYADIATVFIERGSA